MADHGLNEKFCLDSRNQRGRIYPEAVPKELAKAREVGNWDALAALFDHSEE